MPPVDTITINRRFRGPPQSGNGGYVCGLLGNRLGSTVTVRLMAPPPLETPMQVVTSIDGLHLMLGEAQVARAHLSSLDLVAPTAPTLSQAREATSRFAGFSAHPFPGCFVCGPARAEGDGLRIFPGVVEDRGLVAAEWRPAANLSGEDGMLRPEFVWSALDCTGFFAFAPLPDGAPALLGELTLRIDHEVDADRPHVVVGWRIGSEGRKRFAGSALFRQDGRLLAVARATWIVMPPGAAGSVSAT